MRRLLLLLCLLFLALSANAQKRDSLLVVNARWTIDSLDGMVLKRMHFTHKECIGSNQFIAILEIPSESPRRLAFSYEPHRTPTSEQARKHKACAAVNGSFFDMSLHNPICYLRINGEEIGENTPQKSDSIHRKYYQYGLIRLQNGRPEFIVPDSARMWEQSLKGEDVMTAGPMLLLDGRRVPQRTDKTFVSYRHNRTAIGVRSDGTMLLVVVDGRTKESEGLSLPDFSCLLRFLGCYDALNLDGGGSTTMFVEGLTYNGVVNHPSDNGRYDFKGERGVSNCIIVY
ncbi:MAG: phosphodiester glycosidase family protein [Bacteroidales bacterium]|nr:phosphodiester glycosidase family protein [Bacteroidales bacterium]